MSGHEISSAGTAPDAECVLSGDLVEWADMLLVMERKQRTALLSRFGRQAAAKRIVVLGIPDCYGYMQPELVELLKRKCLPHLGAGQPLEDRK